MRLGGRLRGATEILDEFWKSQDNITDILKRWSHANRYAGSSDRAVISNLVFDALRNYRSHAWLADSDAPSHIMLAILMVDWGYTPSDLKQEFDADRFAPALPDEQTLNLMTSRNLSKAPCEIRTNLPDWCVKPFSENFNEEWESEARAMCERAPLDLRLNKQKTDLCTLQNTLDNSALVTTQTANFGLRLPPTQNLQRHPNLTQTKAYQEGWFEIQDEGSQIVSELIFAQPNETILDYCAGAGGKSLAIASLAGQQIKIHAYDGIAKRLQPIKARIKRAGANNIQVHHKAQSLKVLRSKMDRVVVDAPCSGSGTWRRNPDEKWRHTPVDLEQILDTQAEILSDASIYVRPKGFLIYITCSLFPQENEDQIYSFLESNRNFELVSAGEVWQDLFANSPFMPWSADMHSITLSPASTATDGFYFAVLKRNS